MARVIVSTVARSDLHRVVDYLEEHAGRTIALRYALRFDAAFDRIAACPDSGSPRPALGVGTRMVIVDPYLIFYEHVEDRGIVSVLRIVHSHRNVTRDMIRPA